MCAAHGGAQRRGDATCANDVYGGWRMSARETIRIGAVQAHTATLPTEAPGDLTQEMLDADQWTDDMVARAGIPVVDTSIVSVGGGIGSFVFVDLLRIAGVPIDAVKVLGVNDHPWDTYEYLTRNSQIPRQERLRSDSGSTPDNVWGFPSYAVREAWSAKGLTNKLAPLFNVATEPIFTDYYTPKAGQAFETMQKEAERIGYDRCTVKGLVRMSRKRVGGGYFTILTPAAGTSSTRRVAYRSRFVHCAVGYPGLRFLPDLQAYREKYDDLRVVNAYEPHEHVYEELKKRPGTVIVRGGGIVASRILQRLIDDRDQFGTGVQIAHLFRTYVDSSHGPNVFMRRKGADGWAFQGFNWPKGAWGGQLKRRLEKASEEERKRLIDVMGGTNTPHRKLWIKQLERGRKEGWYKTYIGTVKEVVPGEGSVVTRINTADGTLELPAQYVIDATGLEADIKDHRYLADLLDHSGVGRNVKGRLDVEPTFELRGTRNGDGRMYAVGSTTLGGYYVGVDSFLGLQYAALQVVDDLARQGFCKRIGTVRSISQWLKWARGQKI
jgi:hypothetical protein